ncbi:MAG: DNA polymerase III subunit delta [Oscillospiraceae bacterium]|nr:DNA polymerase III subunit delta [Oscillospiraceae bacterium]
MAKKTKAKLDYNALVRRLHADGPARLYLLYGPEEYLRERFLDELRVACVPEGNEFSLRRLNGPALDLPALEEAVNAAPFFTERSFVEVRDWNLNRCGEADLKRLKALVTDIPDYCTVAFVADAANPPDGRLSVTKLLKKEGQAVEFTEPDSAALCGWIASRFRALGKSIGRQDAEHLIFLCGTQMLDLIPEIEKAAAFAAGDTVTRAEIDATASRKPEADVWAMTESLGARRFDAAAEVLSELLGTKENHPILLTALIAQQFRRLYAVKVGADERLDRAEIMELCGVRYDFIYDRLLSAAKPYSLEQLGRIVTLCADYDYRMKSSGGDPFVLVTELFARIAAEAGA